MRAKAAIYAGCGSICVVNIRLLWYNYKRKSKEEAAPLSGTKNKSKGDLMTGDKSEARKEYLRQYRAANREKIKERTRQYRENNRDKINAYKREWAANHPEKISGYKKAWFDKKVAAAAASMREKE